MRVSRASNTTPIAPIAYERDLGCGKTHGKPYTKRHALPEQRWQGKNTEKLRSVDH